MKSPFNTEKKIVAATLIALSFGTAGLAQAASDTPWYVGVSINQGDVSDIDSTSNEVIAGSARTIDIDSDDDTGFGIKVGKILSKAANGNEFSVELSYSELDNDLETLTFNGNVFSAALGAAEGEVETSTALVRALYKFETGIIDPYIGLGIGQTELDVDVRYGGSVGSPAGTQPPFATGGDEGFAVQYRIGAEWNVSEKVGIFLEYTFTDVEDLEFSRTGGGPGGLATTTQSADFDIESINLGVNFRF